MTVKLTKHQVKKIFEPEWLAAVADGTFHSTDIAAKRESWLVLTDLLHRDNLITDDQFNCWSNPY
jgi:hypothetical protein